MTGRAENISGLLPYGFICGITLSAITILYPFGGIILSESRLKTFLGITSAAAISMLGVGIVASGLPARVITLSGVTTSHCRAPCLLFRTPIYSCRSLSETFLTVTASNPSCYLAISSLLCQGSYFTLPMPLCRYLSGALSGERGDPVWATAPAIISIAYPNNKGKMIGIYTAAVYHALGQPSPCTKHA